MNPLLGIAVAFVVTVLFSLMFARSIPPSRNTRGNPPGTGSAATKKRRRERTHWFRGRYVVFAFLHACTGTQSGTPWTTRADAALTVAAHALDTADAIAAERYRVETQLHVDLEAVDARYLLLVTARSVAREALLAAEASVVTAARVHNAPTQCAALRAMQGATVAVRHVGEALARTGVADAPAVADAVAALGVVLTAGPICRGSP